MTALSSLQRRLESALEALQQLGLAYAGDGSKKNEINSAIENLLKELNAIQSEGDQLSNVHVPVDVLRFLDDGKPPEKFLQETVDIVKQRDTQLTHQTDRFKELHSKLSVELSKIFE